MASIKVLAGDFSKGPASYILGNLSLRTEKHKFVGENIPAKEIESIEIATEESVKKLGGAAAWGAVGGLALGPLGLLAGLILGGNKKEVRFVARFKDGRKLLAATDPKTYSAIQAAAF